MLRLLLATRNPHKTREFAEMLGADCEICDLTKMAHVPMVEETGATFEENAILKAVSVSRMVADFVVADDSGLEVAALGGAPGVYSARFAGENASDRENLAKLLEDLLAMESHDDRRARFRCVLTVASQGDVLGTFHGEVAGKIIEKPRGENGFGYDPVFVPEGYDLTFAELGAAMKNQISHRAMAIRQLQKQMSRGLGPRLPN